MKTDKQTNLGSLRLTCGCTVEEPEVVVVYPGGRKLVRCPTHGLVKSKR